MIEWKNNGTNEEIEDLISTTEEVGWYLISAGMLLGACIVWAIVEVLR